MEGLLYIVAAIFLGSLSLSLQKYLMKTGDPVNKNYVFQILGAVGGLALVLLVSDLSKMPSSWLPWAVLVFVSFLWLLGSMLRFMSMELVDLSLISGMDGVRILLVAILSSILLGEVLTIQRVFALAVRFAGLAAATWDKNPFGHLRNKGVQYSLAAAFVIAFNAVVDKVNVVNFDPMFYSWVGFLVPAVAFPFIIKVDFKKVNAIAKTREVWAIGLAATLGTLTYYFILNAYTLMDVQVAYPATRLMSVLALIIGIVFFSERKQIKRRLLGAATAVAGAAMLVG